MKSLFYRENKIKKPIAFLLALVMMTAPFFAHAGLKKDSEAAGGGSADDKYSYEVDVALADIPNVQFYKDGENIKIGSNGVQYIPTAQTYKFDTNYIDLKLNGTEGSISNISWGACDDKYYSAEFDVNSLYYQKKSIDGNVSDWNSGSKITISKDDQCAFIYVKATIKVADNSLGENEQIYREDKVCVAKVEIQDEPLSNTASPQFKHSDNTNYVSEGDASDTNAYLVLPDTPISETYIKYGYIDNDGVFTEVSVSGTSIATSGTYTPCMRYYVPGDADNTVARDFKGIPVSIDAEGPAVTLKILKKNENGQVVNEITVNSGDTVYLSKSLVEAGRYDLKFTGDDSNKGGSGIRKMYFTDTTNVSNSGAQVTNGFPTSYEFQPVNITGIGTIKYSVEDGVGGNSCDAGNVTTGSITIMYDNDAPEISAVAATVNDGSSDVPVGADNFAKGDVKFSATVTDAGGAGLKAVYVHYKDQNGTENSVQLDQEAATDVFSATKSELSGQYEIWVEAEDNAGNTATTKTDVEADKKIIKVDNIAPKDDGKYYEKYECRSMYFDFADFRWKWGNWQAWDPNAGMNVSGMGQGWIEYRVIITVKDKDSGLDIANCGKYEDAIVNVGDRWSELKTTKPNQANETHQFCYQFVAEDNDTGVVIRFVDKAGNVSDCPIWRTKDPAGSDLKFDDDTLKIYEKDNETDGSINLADFTDGNLDININKTYVIEIDASSGYEIKNAKLTAMLSDSTSLEINGVIDNYRTNASGRRVVRIKYEVPGSDVIVAAKNELLSNIKLTVVDSRYDNDATRPAGATDDTKEKTLGQIRYDISKPRLIADTDSEWHNSVDLSFTLTSLPYEGNEIESGFSWYKYEITNSKDNAAIDKTVISGQTFDGSGDKAINVPESDDINGTIITFTAEDRAGNGIISDDNKNVVFVKVDKTNPTVVGVSVDGTFDASTPFKGQPVIESKVADNLTIDRVDYEITYPNDVKKTYTKTVNGEAKNISDTSSYTIEKIDSVVLDGEYSVKVCAYDKAGNPSNNAYKTFKIDNTKPVVTAKVVDGTVSPKNSYYYKDDVRLELTYRDETPASIVVTDNGNAISGLSWQADGDVPNKYKAYITISSAGAHSIAVNATDSAGNAADEAKVAFAIDRTIPSVIAYLNGTTVYNSSMGNIMYTGNTSVSYEISDTVRDEQDNYIQIYKNVPDQSAGNPSYLKTSNTSFAFSDEADYVLNFYTIDKANNPSEIKTVRFRIDKTAPELSIGGFNGATATSAVNATFTMRELFWQDARATVTIYRKAGDGAREELYKTLTFRPSAYQTTMSEALTESGVYRFEFEASDNAGHKSTRSQTLTIDRNAPKVTLTGVKDFDMTDSSVELYIEITDEFYLNKRISLSGTRLDMYGQTNKIQFANFSQSSNPTKITQSFDEDGIYDILLTASDIAGNTYSNKMHFVIDTSAPAIADLSKYDGKVFREFIWDEDLEDIVTDLTVCDVQMLLNGKEYDGESDLADGSYVLLITATDEMGHKAEKEVRFEIDTKAPVFIITGVEDGEVKNEAYVINISLQLDEDTLESVTLNGTNISVSKNTATINVTEKGEYTLVLKAVDAAGNESTQTITFTYGTETSKLAKKSMWWIWILIGCSILLVGGIIIVAAKRRKDR